MRQGAPLVVRGVAGELALVRAAEGVEASDLAWLSERSGSEPTVALSPQRALALGRTPREGAVVVRPTGKLDPAALRLLVDPLASSGSPGALLSRFAVVETQSCHIAAVRLAKLAGLLPAAVVALLEQPGFELSRWAAEHGLALVAIEDILTYEERMCATLRPVSRAWVPLASTEDVEIVAFRPGPGSPEHLAIIIGTPEPGEAVLTRLHSECFTGDLLGSLRCDCGEQLRGAMDAMAAWGSGVIVYLRQEGRGIGLVNKLRTYALQDRGLDTIDANCLLGFAPDERYYRPAAEMLRQLGFTKVRLMTNNPDKLAALALNGIAVVERVPLAYPGNTHNQAYLRAKAVRSGHYLDAAGEAPRRTRERLSS